MPEHTDAARPESAEERVWVEDRNWRVLTAEETAGGPQCSYKHCGGLAVAETCRRGKRGPRRYRYCGAHLYGRRVEGGKVLIDVPAGSVAAQWGWV